MKTNVVRPMTLQAGGGARISRHAVSGDPASRLIAEQGGQAVTAGTAGCCGQRGFTLIEVSIVTAIVLLIAVIGIPAIGGYVMENKVPRVGQELTRFIAHMRVHASVEGDLPYRNINTDNLAAAVGDSTVLTVAGDGRILHGLGAGQITVEPTADNMGFVLRLTEVSHVACPSIASVMQRSVTRISVGTGTGAGSVVKSASTPYSALEAESRCEKGDVNQFVFEIS